MAVTHFVTHFTHVSRHFGVKCRKQKKMFREKCFENVVSYVNKKLLKSPQNYFYKKVQGLQKNKNKKLWKRLQSLADSGDQTTSFGRFLRPDFQNSFPYFLFFSTLNSKMSRKMRKMRHKVLNGQNLPNESPNFTNNFFQSNFTYNLSHFFTSLRPDYQNIFFCFLL